VSGSLTDSLSDSLFLSSPVTSRHVSSRIVLSCLVCVILYCIAVPCIVFSCIVLYWVAFGRPTSPFFYSLSLSPSLCPCHSLARHIPIIQDTAKHGTTRQYNTIQDKTIQYNRTIQTDTDDKCKYNTRQA